MDYGVGKGFFPMPETFPLRFAPWHQGQLGIPGTTPVDGVRVFYVHGIDGIGSDTLHDGLSPVQAYLTLTKALSMCTNTSRDYIVVIDYWQPTGETWPIWIDKDNVHIIGADGGGTHMPLIIPPADTAGMVIAADRVEVGALALGGGATHGCFENDPTGGAAHWGLLIRDCWFGVLGGGQDGFRNVGDGDLPYLTITHCVFGTGLTRDGVRIQFNATRCQIGTPWANGGNLFFQIPGIGVNATGGGNSANLGIFNNLFSVPANTAGGAISIAANVTASFISGNVANFGDTTMGNNPYADASPAGTNNWGLNYQGIVAVMPS